MSVGTYVKLQGAESLSSLVENIPLLRSNEIPVNGEIVCEIGGVGMRCGKSTACKVLRNEYSQRDHGTTLFEEEYWNNPFLQKAYEDPINYGLKSQMWFLMNKFEQRRVRTQSAINIQDLYPEGDYIYALTNFFLGRLSRDDFELYHNVFSTLPWNQVRAPHLYIYIQASESEYLDRVERSKRPFEVVDPNYFLTLKKANDILIQRVLRAGFPVLLVDTDRFNFSENGNHKAEFFQMVNERLLADGWELNGKRE